MTSNKRARIAPIMHHLYIIYIYSERRHSGLQDYVSFEKSTSGGGSPLTDTYNYNNPKLVFEKLKCIKFNLSSRTLPETMNNLNLNAFYEIYHNECNKSKDLFTTKILVYFDVHYTQHNKSIVAEKIDQYVYRNRTWLCDVWKSSNTKQKVEQFANIVVLTQEDFQLISVSQSSTNLKERSRSSASATTSSSTTMSSYASPPSTFPALSPTLTKRQRDFSEVSSRQKRRRLYDSNSYLDEFALSNDLTINQAIGYLL